MKKTQLPPGFESSAIDDMVPVNKMFRPEEYGRGIISRHVEAIAANWHEPSLNRLLVSLRPDGRLAVIDGNNRHAAAVRLGIKELPCKVLIDLDVPDEAVAFKWCNNTKKLTALDVVRADLEHHDTYAIEIRSALRRNGLDFALNGPSSAKVQCVAAIRNVYNEHGLTILTDVLRILVTAFGADAKRAYTNTTIHGTAMFWVRYRRFATSARFEQRLFELLHQTDADKVHTMARTLAAAFHESLSTGWGRSLWRIYNYGLGQGQKLTKNALPDWVDRVYSDKGRTLVAEKRKKANFVEKMAEARKAKGGAR